MSLIGSLEDLSLGDILQIISLSQKSGVLVLRGDDGDGRVVFRAGLVCGAVLKDGPNDLRGILVGGGFVAEEDFERAAAAAARDVGDLGAALCEAGCITRERLDSLRRKAVESAVVEMFRWKVGDFSFDVRETSEPEDPQELLAVGVNAQYLAMEGARCGDEGERDPLRSEPDDVAETETDAMSAHEMFGVEVEPEPAAERELEPEQGLDAPPEAEPAARMQEAVGIVAEAAIEVHAPMRDDETSEVTETTHEEPPEPTLDTAPTPEPLVEAERERVFAAEAERVREAEPEGVAEAMAVVPPNESAVAAFDPSRPVIVIDADLPALEWAKAVLAEQCDRVHIFQRSDLGLTRIRQYLARAVAPVVLLSPATPGDRLSGIADATDFVRRLKQQAPQIRMVWLQEDGAHAIAVASPADAIATRPAGHQLRSGAAGRQAGLAQALRDLVANVGGDAEPSVSSSLPADVLEKLKDTTARLRAASTRGEVLPLVIDYAAQSFRRVAMLMVRDGVAAGMAQHRLSVCGGPDDDELRRVSIPIADSQWLTHVVVERTPVRGAPDGGGDRRLAAALGDRPPGVAYLAPIESAGSVVAIIYGDDLPGGGEPQDTRALEVVLHHAGLALDRAVLERVLAATPDAPAD